MIPINEMNMTDYVNIGIAFGLICWILLNMMVSMLRKNYPATT